MVNHFVVFTTGRLTPAARQSSNKLLIKKARARRDFRPGLFGYACFCALLDTTMIDVLYSRLRGHFQGGGFWPALAFKFHRRDTEVRRRDRRRELPQRGCIEQPRASAAPPWVRLASQKTKPPDKDGFVARSVRRRNRAPIPMHLTRRRLVFTLGLLDTML